MGLVDVVDGCALRGCPFGGCESWVYVVLWMPSLALGGFAGFDPFVFPGLWCQSPRIGVEATRGRRAAIGHPMCTHCLVSLAWARGVGTYVGQDTEASEIGGVYTQITVLGIIPFLMFGVVRQFLQGDGLMMPATWAIIVGNARNFVFNLMFIYGYFGAPELGAIGHGLGYSVVSMVDAPGLGHGVMAFFTTRSSVWAGPSLPCLWLC